MSRVEIKFFQFSVSITNANKRHACPYTACHARTYCDMSGVTAAIFERTTGREKKQQFARS